MTNEQFDVLVSRLEQQAINRPGYYQFKVFLLAMMGNLYLGVVLLIIAALLVALFTSLSVLKLLAVKLIILVVPFLLLILKSLWINVEPPTGTRITKQQAPELFAMINGLRRQLQAPRFHHVLIAEDFNAAVAQIPRLGIFGWQRNYLILGLPLLKALSIDQFKAVLAHEFGHLAKGHGKISNWIYRQRLRWHQLSKTLEANQSQGSFLFTSFLNWFVPYFSAYSFPLARANEYEADHTSARLTSTQTAAEALTNVEIIACFLSEQYWPTIYKQAYNQPQPCAPYIGLNHSVLTDLDKGAVKNWLDQAMNRQTNSNDTHPALQDRLKAMDEIPRFNPPSLEQAAVNLLGKTQETIIERFDKRWKNTIASSWLKQYQEAQKGRQRLTELNTQLEQDGELSVQDAYERAMLTGTVGDDADNELKQLHSLHERAPDDVIVCLGLGTLLINKEDASGCALIEHAMQLDDYIIGQACKLLRDYHWRNARKEEAQQWHQRLLEDLQIQQAANRERKYLLSSDSFISHELSSEVFATLCQQLQAVPGVKKAYLVKKQVKHYKHVPCYVLGYSVIAGQIGFHNKQQVRRVMESIQRLEFPSGTTIINIDGDNSRFLNVFQGVDNSKIL
jgi:Zn-dependent protease with chaperone function